MIGCRVFLREDDGCAPNITTTVVSTCTRSEYKYVFGRRFHECKFSFFAVGSFHTWGKEAAMLRATVVLPPLELRPRFGGGTTWI